MSSTPVTSSSSQAQVANTVNDVIRDVQNMKEVQTFKQSQGVNAIIQGRLPNDGGYGEILYDTNGIARIVMRVNDGTPELKVSKSGFDVLTTGDANLIFNSSYNIFKIISTGTTTVTLPVGYTSYQEYTATVTHNLGNTPMVLGSVDFPAATLEGRFMLPMTLVETSGGTNGVGAFFRINTDNFVCTVKARNSGGDTYKGVYTFRYYILQETAN